MKNRTHALLAALLATLVAGVAPGFAAPERLVVPLSDPARPARLEVSLVSGSITVVAGGAGEVVVEAGPAAVDDEDDHDHPAIAGDSRRGMRRIPNSGFELAAEERGNRVEVTTNSWSRPVDLRITLPAASSLSLSTVNDGDLDVQGIGGEIELHNTNGDIRVRDVRGPVSANTVNGDVTVVFGAAVAAAPMAFSTLNGDVDLTLPGDAKFDVRLKSENGEIYSDFDVELSRQAPKVEEERGRGRYRVSVSQELKGKVGGGGPEIFLKTFNGDILLRRRGA